MSVISIKKNYLNKIKLIKKYNKYYYDKSSPVISDEKYDQLKREIIDIEKKYPNLKNKESPLLNVGFKPSKNFKKIKHRVPMLSLSNAFDEDDLKNFEKKIINFLSLKENSEIEYSTEPKIDGISASIKYENGVLTTGLSRGDGTEGEDIRTVSVGCRQPNIPNINSQIDIWLKVKLLNLFPLELTLQP